MNDIDYSDLNLIDSFVYDIQPNEKGEMMLAFKAGEESYVLPIPKQDLKRMLWYAENSK